MATISRCDCGCVQINDDKRSSCVDVPRILVVQCNGVLGSPLRDSTYVAGGAGVEENFHTESLDQQYDDF